MKRGSFQVFYSIKELTLKLFWRTQCLYSFDIIFMFFKEQFCWSVLRPLVSLCVLHIWGINFSNFHFPKKTFIFYTFSKFLSQNYIESFLSIYFISSSHLHTFFIVLIGEYFLLPFYLLIIFILHIFNIS